jgi:hypothetical protein
VTQETIKLTALYLSGWKTEANFPATDTIFLSVPRTNCCRSEAVDAVLLNDDSVELLAALDPLPIVGPVDIPAAVGVAADEFMLTVLMLA